MNDPARDLRFRAPPRAWRSESQPLSAQQRKLLWSLVAALHLFGLLALRDLMHPPGDRAGRTFEVQLVARSADIALPIPPWPRAPQRASAARARAAPAESPQPNPPPSLPPAVRAPLAPRLFDPRGAVLLDSAPPVAQPWSAQERLLRDRITRLPGHSDAAAAEQVAIRLRRAQTPEDVVMAVLRFLFAQPAVDDCQAIEGRLYMSDPGVSREIDLVKFRKACR